MNRTHYNHTVCSLVSRTRSDLVHTHHICRQSRQVCTGICLQHYTASFLNLLKNFTFLLSIEMDNVYTFNVTKKKNIQYTLKVKILREIGSGIRRQLYNYASIKNYSIPIGLQLQGIQMSCVPWKKFSLQRSQFAPSLFSAQSIQ